MLRLVIILSYLGMPVNLVQYRGTVGVFNNRKFRNKMVANKFYSSKCGFNAELAVLEPSSLHQIILLLLTIVMCMSKDNYVQSIKRLCISFIITISIHSILPLWFYSILITLDVVMLKLIQGLNEILQKHFHFVIGISIVSLLMIMLKFFYSKLI